MTDLIPRDAVISPEVMRVWTAANIHHADEAVFLDAVAAIREAALREAYGVVCKWWFGDGNALPQELILTLIGEKK